MLLAIKSIYILHTADEANRASLRKDVEGSSLIRLVLPPTTQRSVMHGKLMLLFHPTHLRIVLSTANLTPVDWGEDGGVMENSVFLIDLPLLAEDRHGRANKTLTPFASGLIYFVKAIGLFDDVIEEIRKFDFTRTEEMAFVYTIRGITKGAEATSNGLASLCRGVQQLKGHIPRNEPLALSYATSSMGKLDPYQDENWQRAGRGHLPLPFKKGAPQPNEAAANNGLQIVYPSVRTVGESKGGFNAGGKLYFQFYNETGFPKSCVRDYKSARTVAGRGPTSHNKIILMRSKSNASVYLGSHNMSQAAWGQYSSYADGTLKCDAKNWECGVLVRVAKVPERKRRSGGAEVDEADISTASEGEDEDDDDGAGVFDEDGLLPFSVFESAIDVPFEWPPKQYGDDDRPFDIVAHDRQKQEEFKRMLGSRGMF